MGVSIIAMASLSAQNARVLLINTPRVQSPKIKKAMPLKTSESRSWEVMVLRLLRSHMCLLPVTFFQKW